MLAGYGVDLFPGGIKEVLEGGRKRRDDALRRLNLPATVTVATSLGPTGAEFEVRLMLSSTFAGAQPNTSSSQSSSSAISALSSSLRPPSITRSASGRSTPVFGSAAKGTSAGPALEDVIVHVPIPSAVRNMTNIRPSRGEATFQHKESMLEWRIPSKEVQAGRAVCRCTVTGPIEEDDDEEENEEEVEKAFQRSMAAGDAGLYDETQDGYQIAATPAGGAGQEQTVGEEEPVEGVKKKKKKKKKGEEGEKKGEEGKKREKKRKEKAVEYQAETLPVAPKGSELPSRDERKVQNNARLMPLAATVSFSVKGWLASGIKVEGLVVDTRRSKGLGEGVKPYKGVKYLTVSKKGVEARC